MIYADFYFTQYKNSYKVKVRNLESLHVKQIQEIESFVKQRNGLFDFSTYTFVIQKRLDFESFVKLIKSLHIQANIEEEFLEIKKAHRIGFGKYKGLAYNELPDSYMIWLKSSYKGSERKYIEEELQKRKL
jgi:hypothetical protein